MTVLTWLLLPRTIFFFMFVFSLLYLVPESLVPKKKMQRWALVISLAYIVLDGVLSILIFNL